MESEAQHLQMVYQKLLIAESKLSQLIEEKSQSGRSALQEMTGEVRLNFDSYLDNLDTFSAIENLNRQIDQYNLQLDSTSKELAKVRRLLPAPYFGKIRVDFLEGQPPEAFYIGINGFTPENEALIHDWRSPIAELFYNNELGGSSYEVRGQVIPVQMKQRRQLITDHDRLLNYFDTDTTIQDEVLLAALAEDHSQKMQDITATIQIEQNQIIRDQRAQVLLVNGVAGSGKTSTVLQRIAYLLYQNRERYRPDDMLILSPNQQFAQYIAGVLPALGEANPPTLTLLEWLQTFGTVEESEADYFQRISKEEASSEEDVLRSVAFMQYLESELEITPRFVPIVKKGKTILSQEYLQQIFDQTPIGSFAKRIQGMKQRLLQEWERRLVKDSRKVSLQQQILDLTQAQQEKLLGRLLTQADESQLDFLALKLLRKKYAFVSQEIENYAWLDERAMFCEVYQSYEGNSLEVGTFNMDQGVAQCYFHQRQIEPLKHRDYQVILVDEVQDYTPAALYLLKALYPRSRFTLVGDDNQAIFNSYTSFADMQELFLEKQPQYYRLTKSYRTTGNITTFFASLVADKLNMEILPVRPAGSPVVYRTFQDVASFEKILHEFQGRVGQQQITIITKTQKEAEQLQDFVDNFVAVYPVALAKGLEFANVLLYDVSAKNYHSKRDMRLLYTAASRSTKQLWLTYQGIPAVRLPENEQ
ncbi:AAA family ATPase [Enterococcus asini]|uniref:HelD family protein n=1 Tax=Enterococcus asini TaxID=57732 RepID=UPI00288E9E20|nr:UvrD-helicase domain-containing protein [Enterococcus asini]MDT2757251.1 AAA family ATPase [Enterococcus asini]